MKVDAIEVNGKKVKIIPVYGEDVPGQAPVGILGDLGLIRYHWILREDFENIFGPLRDADAVKEQEDQGSK